MSEQTEKDMLDAIAAHCADEGMPYEKLRAIEIRVIAGGLRYNSFARVGSRAYYRNGRDPDDVLLLSAPLLNSGTHDALAVRSRDTLLG